MYMSADEMKISDVKHNRLTSTNRWEMFVKPQVIVNRFSGQRLQQLPQQQPHKLYYRP